MFVMLQVDKIVMFERGQVVHALVQFSEVAAAITARYFNLKNGPVYSSSMTMNVLCRTNLHGANIYRDSCTIKVEFAKQDILNVKTNDDRTWDYTATGQTKTNGQVNGGNHIKVIQYQF